jgi:hypothetical protein
MNIKYPTKPFIDSSDLLNSCNTEHRINCTDAGIQLKSVDPANTYILQIKIPWTSCTSYSAGFPYEFGFSVTAIHKLIQKAVFNDIPLGDTISFDIYSAENPKIKRLDFKTGNISFDINSIDLDIIRPEPRIPQLDFPVSYVVKTEELYNAIYLMESEHVFFKGNEIHANIHNPATNEIRSMAYVLNTVPTSTDNSLSLFNVDLIMTWLKPLRDICEQVTVSIGVDYPIKIEGTGLNGESIIIMNAPRIESD